MRLRLLTAALLAVVLAACGGGGDSGSSGSTAASAGTTPAVTSTVASAETPATGAAPWPAPPDPMGLSQKAGLAGESAERLQYHVHAHLDVFINGERTVVPAGIGIDIANPAVKQFPMDAGQVGYGLQAECASPCISPLHTHDPSGVIHTESATAKPHVLGQFFTQWGVALDANCVGGYCKPKTSIAFYVDGQAFAGDPTSIELSDGREIAIVIGTPPAIIPAKFDASAV